MVPDLRVVREKLQKVLRLKTYANYRFFLIKRMNHFR